MNGLRKLASNIRKNRVTERRKIIRESQSVRNEKNDHKGREVGIAFEFQVENKRFFK